MGDIYMKIIECPKCSSSRIVFGKRWEIKSPKTGAVVKIAQAKCDRCGKSFRVYA